MGMPSLAPSGKGDLKMRQVGARLDKELALLAKPIASPEECLALQRG